jgi:hypothetical protein
LVAGIPPLLMASSNGVRHSVTGGEELARVGDHPAVSLLLVGSGEVLVLADVGILGAPGGQAPNLGFWQNLARYVRTR